jgi:DNA-binding response OmpR family regulator
LLFQLVKRVAKILLVEDDLGLTRIVRDWLLAEKHSVESVSDGKEGLEQLRFYQFDLVILDVNLPGMNGLEVLQQFRSVGGATPVLMLTGNDTVSDIEKGLSGGADDYLTKPFHMRELSARLRALLRRTGRFVGDQLNVRNITLDTTKFEVTKNGEKTSLLPKEFALLEFFMRHPNEVFSPEALLNRVWPSSSDATVDALTTCVKRLRKKLDDEGKPSIITTVHGRGYKLESE